jgi:hypothetical protein
LKFIIELCNYCRIIKAITEGGSIFFYWALMIFAVLYQLTIISLIIYMHFSSRKGEKKYMDSAVSFLRYQILLLYWVFYLPFFESFISIFNCDGGYHYVDKSL